MGDASLRGCSHLDLPRPLRRFPGNIGFHHIHHLNSQIPNHRLPECQEQLSMLGMAPPLTLWDGLTTWRYCLCGYCLCNEANGTMVPFPEWN